MFEGSGTQALVFNFFRAGGTVTMSGQSGTLTYDFTPAVAAVPEPSTWAMMTLGFAGLGLLGYRKTRGALA
jgi:PEP-CTERM motif